MARYYTRAMAMSDGASFIFAPLDFFVCYAAVVCLQFARPLMLRYFVLSLPPAICRDTWSPTMAHDTHTVFFFDILLFRRAAHDMRAATQRCHTLRYGHAAAAHADSYAATLYDARFTLPLVPCVCRAYA